MTTTPLTDAELAEARSLVDVYRRYGDEGTAAHLAALVPRLLAQLQSERELHRESSASYHETARRTCESLAAQVATLTASLATAREERDAAVTKAERWRNCFICVECGRGKADEEGCCATCGRDVLIFEGGKLTRPMSHFYDRDAIETEADEVEAERDSLRSSLATATARVAEVEGRLARVMPVVEAAVNRHTVECEGLFNICRESVDWHDSRCAVRVAQAKLANACDAFIVARAATNDALAKGGDQ